MSLFDLLPTISLILATATGTVYAGSVLSVQSDAEENSSRLSNNGSSVVPSQASSHEEITLTQALGFPLYASAALLTLFFFFNYVQYLLIFMMTFSSAVALYTLLHLGLSKICCARYPFITLIAVVVDGVIILEWLLTGNWICHNILCVALCILFLHTLRFPSLKIATLCLCLLLVYDAFWVFYSERFFTKNVMVEVATKQATNPLHDLAAAVDAPTAILSLLPKTMELPLKLLFPAALWFAQGVQHSARRMMMLGLGDICLPGALVAFALRADLEIHHIQSGQRKEDERNDIELSIAFNSRVEVSSAEGERLLIKEDNSNSTRNSYASNHNSPSRSPLTSPRGRASKPYIADEESKPASRIFEYSLASYLIGLTMAFLGNFYSGHAQPALIYLVPCVLLAVVGRAYAVEQLLAVWNGVAAYERQRFAQHHRQG